MLNPTCEQMINSLREQIDSMSEDHSDTEFILDGFTADQVIQVMRFVKSFDHA